MRYLDIAPIEDKIRETISLVWSCHEDITHYANKYVSRYVCYCGGIEESVDP